MYVWSDGGFSFIQLTSVSAYQGLPVYIKAGMAEYVESFDQSVDGRWITTVLVQVSI